VEPTEVARFETLVLPHLDAAYTLARYLIHNDDEAKDVVQDAYLRALKYFHGFRGVKTAEARPWLLAIVRNTAFTRRRRQRWQADTLEFDERIHSDAVEEAHPETELLETSSRESLHQAIDALPLEFREVILLRELEGLSYKEIGEVIGVPLGTVMSRLARARQRLQRALLAERREA
jgi:RNA polymerase sigma factor (sigma-70 family)